MEVMSFTKLSDVEVVAEPTESANVLIEEDGVIKKAPKTAVGGAGAKPDMIIDIAGEFTDTITTSNVTVTSGNFTDVSNKLLSSELVDIRVREHLTRGETGNNSHNEIKARGFFYGSTLYVSYACQGYAGWQFYIRCIKIKEGNKIASVQNTWIESKS